MVPKALLVSLWTGQSRVKEKQGMMLTAAAIQLAALSTDWSDTLSLSSKSQLLQIARTSADVMVACNVYNNG
ncbi:hypothetical protein CHS0354_004624 [Potamilus streckersoni]|uniref:Uncharacterized protein n=1 Tax=Potamilus streckersoni TaxID=2493646 RepID=A0AAE0S5E2_9BIVA|nr:hypothetical protein CHS0354_004624 [Potamilus streckersoni]